MRLFNIFSNKKSDHGAVSKYDDDEMPEKPVVEYDDDESDVDSEIRQMREMLASGVFDQAGGGDNGMSRSWGTEMPAEENQYSFPGSYVDYFLSVFDEEFPEYKIACADGKSYNPSTVITFWKGGDKALVVELLSDKSEVVRLRNACRRQGIPYLRFYYNHKGWWNTRSYVVSRTRAALAG